jgi:putative ABC transport system permease protein
VFERTFAITYALQMISSIVAGIAVLSVLFALVSERKQDLALLQSIGATNTQVTLLVVCKALLMGVTGLIGGITTGYFVGVILVEVVNLQSFNWTLRFAMPWMEILMMTGLVLLACCLAAIAPALTVSNQRIQEVLRADE